LLGEGHGGVGGLGEEDGGHGEVDGRAVEIERVTGGDDEADGGLACPEGFHFGHHAGEGGFGRRGAEDDEELFSNVAEEAEDTEAVDAGD